MNSKLYVPDPNQWKKYFEKKPSDNLKVDTSTIKLTSPIQSVVQRAKSELERINSAPDVKPLISASTANKSRSSNSKKRIKQKRLQKTNITRKIKKKCKRRTKTSNDTSNKKSSSKKRNKKTSKQIVIKKDIFG